jgi:hypothetical protein
MAQSTPPSIYRNRKSLGSDLESGRDLVAGGGVLAAGLWPGDFV